MYEYRLNFLPQRGILARLFTSQFTDHRYRNSVLVIAQRAARLYDDMHVQESTHSQTSQPQQQQHEIIENRRY